jgi:hypothetical protein
VWNFFNAHPTVFVLTVTIVVCALVYLFHLLVTHAGSRGEFRIGPTGLYYRGGDADPPPGIIRRAWLALQSRKQATNPPAPSPSAGQLPGSMPSSEEPKGAKDLDK